jgi:mono/diheme cytochrome c family protein
MSASNRRPVRLMAALSLAALSAATVSLLPAPALADGGRLQPRSPLPAYTQECASCHVAYPPALLPARSWQRVMGGLKQHYGSDASLDAATAASIGAWLQANAGTYKRVAEEPPQDRLTRSAWFERKHRRIDASVWALPSVKSPAQCAACHTGAEQGRYDDDSLRYPEGLSLRQRWMWHD